jgi:hypothetical protein
MCRRSPQRSASSAVNESRSPSHLESSPSANTTSPPGPNTPPAATSPPSPSPKCWPGAYVTRFAPRDIGLETHPHSVRHPLRSRKGPDKLEAHPEHFSLVVGRCDGPWFPRQAGRDGGGGGVARSEPSRSLALEDPVAGGVPRAAHWGPALPDPSSSSCHQWRSAARPDSS